MKATLANLQRHVHLSSGSMTPLNRHHSGARVRSATSELVRSRGSLLTVSGRLAPLPQEAEPARRLTKVLVKVSIEGSLGPVQLVMSPENTVADLVKAAIETYVKEKRRPLLNETDHRRLELHYSPFSLDSLKGEEKLTNLESRNFFLCQKPMSVGNSTCSDEANKAANCPTFLFTKFMDFLL